jgi:hypothetical protein
MTLFQLISDKVPFGYSIGFRHEPFQVAITVARDGVKRESWLPTSDHFYEDRVVESIKFMIAEIDKKIDARKK